MNKERIDSAARWAVETGVLTFPAPVSHVYRVLEYAREMHEAYMNLWGDRAELFLLGMNPGPWGMAQTGVPFGEVSTVRDWMGLRAPVGRPAEAHPARPVTGLACPRSEVSGARLWGWLRERYGTAENCLSQVVVHNYCPLLFLRDTGANLPPERLRAADRAEMERACDRHLRVLVGSLEPACLAGVGRYAAARLRAVFPGRRVIALPHPSPANPAANRGWADAATRILRSAGVWA